MRVKTINVLLLIVVILSAIGIVMLFSASAMMDPGQGRDPFFFLKRQTLWILMAAVMGAVASRVNYHHWRTLALPMVAFTVVLLVLVFTPLGAHVKGSSRWLKLGPMTFQPSELAKFAVVVLLAWWMARVQRRADELKRGLVIPLASLGVIFILIFREPDFGTAMLIIAVGMTMMFIGGSRIGYLVIAGALGLVFMTLAIFEDTERAGRMVSFTNPERFAQDEAFQLINSLYAFVVGGGMGAGLGAGLQKQYYLPEAHTDFILAIVGEELGLPGSLLVVILFFGFFLCGLRISFRAPDKFGKLLAFGITLTIVVQAAINIGVVTGCLPTKGIPLPFISFGGSSMMISMIMIGVMANIARHSVEHAEDHALPLRDTAHRF